MNSLGGEGEKNLHCTCPGFGCLCARKKFNGPPVVWWLWTRLESKTKVRCPLSASLRRLPLNHCSFLHQRKHRFCPCYFQTYVLWIFSCLFLRGCCFLHFLLLLRRGRVLGSISKKYYNTSHGKDCVFWQMIMTVLQTLLRITYTIPAHPIRWRVQHMGPAAGLFH